MPKSIDYLKKPLTVRQIWQRSRERGRLVVVVAVPFGQLARSSRDGTYDGLNDPDAGHLLYACVKAGCHAGADRMPWRALADWLLERGHDEGAVLAEACTADTMTT